MLFLIFINAKYFWYSNLFWLLKIKDKNIFNNYISEEKYF